MQKIIALASAVEALIYGGIGQVVSLIPKFIDGVFIVSGMLVP
jgi:hypothetical protein